MTRKKSVVRQLKWLVSAAGVLSLWACGGDSSPDPLQKYHDQVVQWTECDSTILGAPTEQFEQWKSSGRLSCGYMSAPLDWSNTNRGDISVAVMRMAAAKTEERKGALVFNPGGPGIDGLSLTFRLVSAFADSNPENPEGAKQLRLLDEYDMVGFSPRGVGASTRLDCATNELERFTDQTTSAWSTVENLENIEYNSRKTVEACKKNPLTPYINSDATARDMDLLRSLLGDEKLNYVGYSYGTWLGAWYASLFPERVGRMVLDSATNFTTSFEEAALFPQPTARQRLLHEVLAPYAVRHADYFHLGLSTPEVLANVSNLSQQMQDTLGRPLSGLSYNTRDSDEYLKAIAAAKGLDAVLKEVPDIGDEDAVERGLEAYVFDPRNEKRDQELREYAGDTLAPIYAAIWISPTASSFSLSLAAGEAIRCNDTPASTDWPAWLKRVEAVAPVAPMFFSTLLNQRVCGLWGGPSVQKPDYSPMKQLNVMFLQTEYDSATYAEGANTFFAQLPTSQRVYVSGSYQHAVYPYLDQCVDPLVTSYLLGEPSGPREKICQAKPLQKDAERAQAQAKNQSPSAGGSEAAVYKNPDAVEQLINEFKQGLIPLQHRLP